jgi:predicted transcriptional regulator
MRKYDIGVLPVVDRDDRVVGMVTDRDLFLELARRNAPPSEIFVDEAMTDRPAVCSSEDDVLDCLETMRRNRVRRLPVVDEDDRLEGIISIDDIICHAAQGKDGKDLPYEDVIEALCEITQAYEAETGQRGAHRERGYDGGRRYRRYRREAPEFEETVPRHRRGRAGEASERRPKAARGK